MFTTALLGAGPRPRMRRSAFALLVATFLISGCEGGAPPIAEPSATPTAPALEPASRLQALPGIATAPAKPTGEGTLSPYFVVDGGDPDVEALPLESTHAQVKVAGAIADVTVTQAYRNAGTKPIEAIYVFPASTRAAVHGLTMKIGQRTIEAHIRERSAARREYQAARATGHTATLLEQQRPNVFTMNVANILPGDRIEVTLRYAELLVPTDGVYELVYPTVVGPRYSNQRTKAPSPNDPEGLGNIDSHDRFVKSPFVAPGGNSPSRFGLDATIETPLPVRALDCPSHPHAQLGSVAPQVARVTIADSDDAGNRDVRIRYSLAGDAIETGMLVEPGADESHFVLMMAPPARVAPDEIVPREYIFVVDVSGSMEGFPLEVSRRLMQKMITGLRPEDRFNVLTFSGGNALLAERSLRATAEGKARGLAFIGNMQSGGGTELLPALKVATTLPRDANISRSIVVVTDGYVTVEQEAFELIRAGLDRANVFAFGIGDAVNRHLIEGMARAGQGEAFVVTNQAEADAQAERLASYIRAPVLVGAKLRFDGFDVYDVEQPALPDLFASKPIVVTGKYRGALSGRAILSGFAGGRAVEQIVDVATAQRSSGLGLGQLWARARIERLGDLEAANGQPDEQITRLGLAYHLMTQHTSFVAVDSEVRTAPVRPIVVPQPSPSPEDDANASGVLGVMRSTEGSHQAAIFGPVTAMGNDAENVLGGLVGTSIGEATGGGGFGLGMIGTIGRGGGSGYGRGAGGLGGHRASSPDAVPGTPMVSGSLDREIIRRIIRRHLNEVRFLYEKELMTQPALKGTIVLRFTIDPTGAVTSASIVSDTVGSKAFAQGLMQAVQRWAFPKPAGGGSVVVNYPFMLSPAR